MESLIKSTSFAFSHAIAPSLANSLAISQLIFFHSRRGTLVVIFRLLTKSPQKECPNRLFVGLVRILTGDYSAVASSVLPRVRRRIKEL
ncbi:hypothetical protein [Brunnivagina elsteri]|uniref:hypothetical protein n=1 Tax=Brunnivagina elsteri TaxID=1247191 RepID=UPI001177CB15|nr:hypothetical protein [Calothrix elsteri]